ncbi:het-domain-containing protein [Diplodia corticola]|uniref:Het-domain-containing protein n=1 Tax=Diplodia corticola TaxID=236234 RepID=A0A1J9R8M6_9PEZI|nr:het-domain-containing protein [Diplodia corticola]OJD37910.1 het-domain-containing protein [Diplodia corticola]
MNKYDYKRTKLHSGEIRLFKLHSGSGSDQLEGNLVRRKVKRSNLSAKHEAGLPNVRTNGADSTSNTPFAEEYLALSYTWGMPARGGEEKFLRVIDTNETYKIEIKPNLHGALMRLRDPVDTLLLWIDAICINQSDNREKSSQIPRMSDIFNEAKKVCIWLGPTEDESNLAMDFIQKCLDLDDFSQRFSQDFSEKWHAVSKLMRRPWFSRRWIVQELARARNAEVYCGDHKPMQWQDFADGMSLMSAHQKEIQRLFRESKRFGHHPDLVGDLSELAAVKLIHIVDHIFRKSDNGEIIEELLPLDALMSSLAGFDTSNPRDVMYAILWLANDARPGVKDSEIWKISQKQKSGSYSSDLLSPGLLLMTDGTTWGPAPQPSIGSPPRSRRTSIARAPDGKSLQVTLHRQPSNSITSIMENKPVSSPTQASPKDTVFAIDKAVNSDQAMSEALDGPDGNSLARGAADLSGTEPPSVNDKPRAEPNTSVRKDYFTERHTAKPSEDFHDQDFQHHDQIVVNIPVDGPEDRKNRVLSKWVGVTTNKWVIVDYDKSVFEVCKDFIKFSLAQSKSLDMMLCPWAPPVEADDPPLPSWIPSLTGKPFGPDANGVHRRVKADALVGTPGLTTRIYNASRNKPASAAWPPHEDRCVSVQGFILDRVSAKADRAMEGVIPVDWLELVGWDPCAGLPPDRFWRSLVGNVDAHGRRPPPYWKRICRDAFGKRQGGGNLDTKQVINSDCAPPIREFLERVQRVVWERKMFKLKQLGDRSLGIGPKSIKKGDLICILHGCSVPVVLRRMVGGKPTHKDAVIPEKEENRNVHYQLIGECFIHGMMNGEAYRLDFDPKNRQREFKLK